MKKQERQARDLRRQKPDKAPHDRILIVSEGRKTEPNYFNEIRRFYRLQTASVVVRPSDWGTGPLQVVEYALKLFNEGDPYRDIEARSFDHVYAVFDRDDHEQYFDALRKAKSVSGTLRTNNRTKATFTAIPSVPCFELWLLLHFEQVARRIGRIEVLKRLMTHLPEYEKGSSGWFAATMEHLQTARDRARMLETQFGSSNGKDPFTAVVEVVDRLISLHNGADR